MYIHRQGELSLLFNTCRYSHIKIGLFRSGQKEKLLLTQKVAYLVCKIIITINNACMYIPMYLGRYL
jgi:hypothetical protein